MATTSEVTRRIDGSLDAIGAEVAFLPELVNLWDEDPPDTRLDYALEWDELMDRLDGLDNSYRTGRMTGDQRRRYHGLLAELSAALPAIERLRLDPPRVALTA